MCLLGSYGYDANVNTIRKSTNVVVFDSDKRNAFSSTLVCSLFSFFIFFRVVDFS